MEADTEGRDGEEEQLEADLAELQAQTQELLNQLAKLKAMHSAEQQEAEVAKEQLEEHSAEQQETADQLKGNSAEQVEKHSAEQLELEDRKRTREARRMEGFQRMHGFVVEEAKNFISKGLNCTASNSFAKVLWKLRMPSGKLTQRVRKAAVDCLNRGRANLTPVLAPVPQDCTMPRDAFAAWLQGVLQDSVAQRARTELIDVSRIVLGCPRCRTGELGCNACLRSELARLGHPMPVGEPPYKNH